MPTPEDEDEISPVQFPARSTSNGPDRLPGKTLHLDPARQSRDPFAPRTFNTTLTVTTTGPFGAPEDSPRQKPLRNAGFRAGEIIGHRLWLVKNRFLHSTIKDVVKWEPGKPVQGEPLGKNPFRGVHAFKVAGEKLDEYVEEVRVVHWLRADVLNPTQAAMMLLLTSGRLARQGWLCQDLDPLPGNLPESPPMVIGKVALWGDIVEHEYGYRAEFGKVKSLDKILWGDYGMLRELRTKYNCQTGGSGE